MSEKNFFLIVILLFTFASIIHFNGNIPQTKITNEQTKDNLDNLDIPKCSAVKVTSIQNFTTDNIYAVSISADGSYIAIGSLNNVTLFNKSSSVKMWNYTTAAAAQNVIISSNGEYIIANTGGTDRQLYLFNKSFSLYGIPMWNRTFNDYISSIAISADGKYIVAGSSENVTLFDNTFSLNKKPLWTYNTTNDVYSVAISADGKYIAVGHGQNVTLIDRIQEKVIWTYNTTTSINQVDISYNGRYIVAGHNASISYFDTTLKTILWKYDNYQLPNHEIWNVDMSEDGKYLVARATLKFRSGLESEVGFFNNSITTPKEKIWKYGKSGDLADPRISSNGKYAVVGFTESDSTYNISLLDRSYSMNNKPLWSYDLSAIIESVAISGIGDYFVAGCNDGKTYLFHHDVSIPRIPIIIDDDDDDDEQETVAIPFGNYFLLFIIITIISLILIQRRKVIFSKK